MLNSFHLSCTNSLLKSFYCRITLLAAAILIALASYLQYSRWDMSNFYTVDKRTVSEVSKTTLLPNRWIKLAAQGKLEQVVWQADLIAGSSHSIDLLLQVPTCVVSISVNGQAIDHPRLMRNKCHKAKRRKRLWQLDLRPYTSGDTDHTLSVMTYAPKGQNVPPKATALYSKTNKWIIYAMTATIVLWIGLLLGYDSYRHGYLPPIRSAVYSQHTVIVAILLCSTIGLLIRIYYLPTTSHDMRNALLKWYGQFQQHGFGALRNNFYIYPPLYLYMLGLTEWALPNMPAKHAIKFLSIAGDFIAAMIAFRLVSNSCDKRAFAVLAFAGFMISPIVFINSGLWGQCDILYTLLLLASIFYFLRNQPFIAMLCWSLSLCIKIQAIFFAPFIFIWWLKSRFHWSYLLLPIICYIISIVPAALYGADLATLLRKHIHLIEHADKRSGIVFSASNPYMFMPYMHYNFIMPMGIAITMALLGTIAMLSLRYEKQWDMKATLLTATLILALIPYTLPNMYDRYFYAAAAFSIPLAAVYWRTIPAAICLNLAALGYPHSFIPNPLGMSGYHRQITGMILNSLALLQLFIIWGYHLYRNRKANQH